MESTLDAFGGAFLKCFTDKEPTHHDIATFVSVAKRADFEHLMRGDVILPLKAPLLRSLAQPGSTLSCFLSDPSEQNLKLLEAALSSCPVPVCKVQVSNGVLRMHLHRESVMRQTFSKIKHAGLKYGASKLLDEVLVTIHHIVSPEEQKQRLHALRGQRLVTHLLNLITFSGGTGRLLVENAEDDILKQFSESMKLVSKEKYRTDNTHKPSIALTSQDQNLLEFDAKLRAGNEKIPTLEGAACNVSVEKECNTAEVHESASRNPQSNDKFQKSVTQGGTESLDQEDKRFQRREMGNEEGTELCVASREDEAQLDSDSNTQDSSIHLVVAEAVRRRSLPAACPYEPVVDARTGKKCSGSVEEFKKVLVEELQRACEAKHGAVSRPEWEGFLAEQAQRCLTLQLLALPHTRPLRVNFQPPSHNTRDWTFLLYNYSRLSTLFESFEESVTQDGVSPLPPVQDVDFSLLRQDEEWELVWVYLVGWPELIVEVAQSILDPSRRVKLSLVTRFLSSLAHRLSQYYGRYHVLHTPPHLQPLMHARLHLLHALHTVMQIGFNLVGIESLPSFM